HGVRSRRVWRMSKHWPPLSTPFVSMQMLGPPIWVIGFAYATNVLLGAIDVSSNSRQLREGFRQILSQRFAHRVRSNETVKSARHSLRPYDRKAGRRIKCGRSDMRYLHELALKQFGVRAKLRSPFSGEIAAPPLRYFNSAFEPFKALGCLLRIGERIGFRGFYPFDFLTKAVYPTLDFVKSSVSFREPSGEKACLILHLAHQVIR